MLETALSREVPTASMINKSGAVVVANADSVARVLDEMGGQLTSLLVSKLSDGASAGAWPISTYTYFVIRKNHHVSVGNCERRKAAMEYLYNFYSSPAVAASAHKLGFATLSPRLVSIVRETLVNSAMCDNGEYALAKYRTIPTPIMTTEAFGPTLDAYLSAYANVNPTSDWELHQSSPDSRL